VTFGPTPEKVWLERLPSGQFTSAEPPRDGEETKVENVAKILAHLRESPGATAEDLIDATELSHNTVRTRLKELAETDQVRCDRSSKPYRFYVPDTNQAISGWHMEDNDK